MSIASDTQNPAASAKKISLRTADDAYFDVEESVAMEFGAVKNFFEDNCSEEARKTAVPLPNVSAKSLSKIIEYCGKELEFRAMTGKAKEEAKQNYDEEFLSDLNREDLKELVLAVNYLEIKYLLDVLTRAVAKLIENKSVAFVRNFFGIENDFTPEEEARLRNENNWAFENVEDD